ncbi:MAG: hypothetical protein ACOCWF_01300 [Halochromatium sp.]
MPPLTPSSRRNGRAGDAGVLGADSGTLDVDGNVEGSDLVEDIGE